MNRLRNLPPDPVEAAQVPVDGVDLAETDSAVQDAPDPKRPQGFPENEGLVDSRTREAPGGVESVEGESRESAVQAAQRGRTA